MPIYSLLLLAMPVPTADPPPRPPQAVGFRFSRAGSFDGSVAIEVSRTFGQPMILHFRRELAKRGGPAQIDHADSASCPGSAAALAAAEKLPMPIPDVPGFGAESTTIIMDGANYRLEAYGVHRDGQSGRLSIESNVGSPLALWMDEMFETLEPCWRPAG